MAFEIIHQWKQAQRNWNLLFCCLVSAVVRLSADFAVRSTNRRERGLLFPTWLYAVSLWKWGLTHNKHSCLDLYHSHLLSLAHSFPLISGHLMSVALFPPNYFYMNFEITITKCTMEMLSSLQFLFAIFLIFDWISIKTWMKTHIVLVLSFYLGLSGCNTFWNGCESSTHTSYMRVNPSTKVDTWMDNNSYV